MQAQTLSQRLLSRCLILICSVLLSTSAIADDDNPYNIPCGVAFFGCSDESDDSGTDILAILLVGTVVYVVMESNDLHYTEDFRRINDFAHGKGYRLNSYNSWFNINLLSLEKQNQTNLFNQKLASKFNADAPERRLNLIEINVQWN